MLEVREVWVRKGDKRKKVTMVRPIAGKSYNLGGEWWTVVEVVQVRVIAKAA
jgi:hypothetical protein